MESSSPILVALGLFPFNRPGRPALEQHLVDLIVQLARENCRWGYMRIKGELRNLGFSVSATSIRNVLLRNDLDPAPRRPSVTWRQFLRAQACGIVACDFFTIETVRLKTLHVLFFVELGTRRLGGVTANPDGAWMVQQAREYSMATQGTNPPRFLIHDRDSKFSGPFDEDFSVDGVKIILTPVRAPNANAHAERWVRTVRKECLDWMLIFGQRHLIRVLGIYIEHYNRERPHRSRNLCPPLDQCQTKDRPAKVSSICRRDRLVGLLHEYFAEDAAA